jgi:hypothetical protein
LEKKVWEATRPEDPLTNEDQLPKLTDAEILTSDGKIFLLTKEEMWEGFRVDDKFDASPSNFESGEFMEMVTDYIWSVYIDSTPEICAKTLKEAMDLIQLDVSYKPKFNDVENLN